MRGVLTGNKLEQTPAPMDWTAVNARLIAFASPGVVDALVDAMEAQHDFEAKLARFAFVKESRHSRNSKSATDMTRVAP
jgi:hypothetical protein